MSKFVKCLLFLCFFYSTSVFGVTITQQGSGQLNWLSNGNACWRACFKAVNQAKQRIENIAKNHCSQGYAITSYPRCSWPASDPSFLDWGGRWPVCKCTDTCTASFTCNQSGQTPSFFGNVAQQWRQVRVFTMQHRNEVRTSEETMRSLRNVGALVQAVNYNVAKTGVNAGPFYEKLEMGYVKYVEAPEAKYLLREFRPRVRYGVKPIKPVRPTPIVPGPGLETPGKPIVKIGN